MGQAMELYQSLVTVNPVTLIAQIANLFIQLVIVKIFFLDKIKAVLDQRKELADKEIAQAEFAHAEAMSLRTACQEDLRNSRARADELILTAQKTASARSEEIIRDAQHAAAQIRQKAEADISLEKKKAVNDAKNEISELAMIIAYKVVSRELKPADQSALVDNFIDQLGDGE